jgi:hypothetical protein
MPNSLPELARSNNLAVGACAVFVVRLVPEVLGTSRLAIRALVDPRRDRSGRMIRRFVRQP